MGRPGVETLDAAEELEIIDVSGHQPKKIPSPTWRECIKKVWEVDPLECPKCGAEMKIVSFIIEVPVIEKILRHLGLWDIEKPGRPLPEIVREDETASQPFDDGWPSYEEPSITLN